MEQATVDAPQAQEVTDTSPEPSEVRANGLAESDAPEKTEAQQKLETLSAEYMAVQDAYDEIDEPTDEDRAKYVAEISVKDSAMVRGYIDSDEFIGRHNFKEDELASLRSGVAKLNDRELFMIKCLVEHKTQEKFQNNPLALLGLL